jgi:hypothetical protein
MPLIASVTVASFASTDGDIAAINSSTPTTPKIVRVFMSTTSGTDYTALSSLANQGPARQERNSKSPALPAAPTPSVSTLRPTRGAIRLRPSFANIEGAPANVRTVQGRYGFVGGAFRHLHESKTSRAACFPIGHYLGTFHAAIRFEKRTERVFGCAEIQVSYKNFLHLNLLVFESGLFEAGRNLRPGVAGRSNSYILPLTGAVTHA